MKNSKVLAAGALAALAACHQGSDQRPPAASAANTRAPVAARGGPTPEELTTGMVEAVTQGKPLGQMALKFDLSQRPIVGEPLEVTIALLPRVAANPVTVAVSAGEGLQVDAGAGQFDLASVDPTQVYREVVTVTPSAEGVQFLTFKVAFRHDEVTDIQEFAVPVIVAAAAAAPATPDKPTSSVDATPKPPASGMASTGKF